MFCLVRRQPSIGQALRNLRIHAGLTLEEVGDTADVSPTYLSRVETGKSHPSDAWVSTVLDALSTAMRSSPAHGSKEQQVDLGVSA